MEVKFACVIRVCSADVAVKYNIHYININYIEINIQRPVELEICEDSPIMTYLAEYPVFLTALIHLRSD
jgi:hypothetical protein